MSTPCLAVDLVTFDVGRTLLTLRPDQPEEWSRVLAEAGMRVEPEPIRDALARERPLAAARREETVPPDHHVSVEAGDHRRRTFVADVLRRAGLDDGDLERAVGAVRAALDSPRMYRVYDDALPTLRELWLRGLKLGVVSNTWPSMPRILLGLGFGEYLGFWVISEFVGVEKPHPEIFARALEIGASEPGRAVHVGDDWDTDVVGARGVGMAAVLVDREGRGRHEPRADVRVVHSLGALLELIG
jgi:putative hydrolase of the HAD superfamily